MTWGNPPGPVGPQPRKPPVHGVRSALRRLITVGYAPVPPEGCADCPFSSRGRDIDYEDPDAGYYRCMLPATAGNPRPEEIWGEEPLCTEEEWKLQAGRELVAVYARAFVRGTGVNRPDTVALAHRYFEQDFPW